MQGGTDIRLGYASHSGAGGGWELAVGTSHPVAGVWRGFYRAYHALAPSGLDYAAGGCAPPEPGWSRGVSGRSHTCHFVDRCSGLALGGRAMGVVGFGGDGPGFGVAVRVCSFGSGVVSASRTIGPVFTLLPCPTLSIVLSSDFP